MTRKFLLLFVFLLFVNVPTLKAQFEGEVVFRAFNPGQAEQEGRFMHFLITPQRILMQSEDQYRLMRGVRANGLLIRHDLEDFVFKTDETEGIQISKNDIDGLSQMMDRFQGNTRESAERFDWDLVEETGETREISEYTVKQLKVHHPEEDSYISVWLTDEIKVNWGVLYDTWSSSTAMMVQSDLPIEVFMNRNSFPLLIEYYKNDNLNAVIEAVKVTNSGVDENLLEIPADMRLLGFNELIMRMMRDRP